MTYLIFKKTVQKTLGPPFNQCLKSGDSFDSDLYRQTIQSTSYSYREDNCYDVCFKNEYHKRCATNASGLHDNTRSCQAQWPLECDSVLFDTHTETLNFDSITWQISPDLWSNQTFNMSNIFNIYILIFGRDQLHRDCADSKNESGGSRC